MTNTQSPHSVLFLKHLIYDSDPQRWWWCCLYLSLCNEPGVCEGREVDKTSLPHLEASVCSNYLKSPQLIVEN